MVDSTIGFNKVGVAVRANIWRLASVLPAMAVLFTLGIDAQSIPMHELASTKSLPLSIEQSYLENKVPIQNYAIDALSILRRICGYADVELLPFPSDGSPPAGLCMRLKIVGESLGAKYQEFWNSAIQVAYTGATVKITLEMLVDGAVVLTKEFSESVYPAAVYEPGKTELRPFLSAAMQSSFPAYFLNAFGSACGPTVFFKAVADPSCPPEVALAAIAALRDQPPEVSESALIGALGHRYAPVRTVAAESLGRIKSKAAVDPLRKALTDPSQGLRCFAARALGQIGDERAVPDLLAAARDKAPEVREAAAISLSALGDPAAPEVLLEFILDRDVDSGKKSDATKTVEDALSAANSTRHEPYDQAIPKLEKSGRIDIDSLFAYASPGTDWSLQAVAFYILDRLEDPRVEDWLIAKLEGCIGRNDLDQYCTSLINSMWSRRDPKAIDVLVKALKKNPKAYYYPAYLALTCCLKNDATADDRVSRWTIDADPAMRGYAATLLVDLGFSDAADTLVAMLDDKNASVRANATLGLGKLNAKKAIGRVLTILKSPSAEEATAAAKALGGFGDPSAILPLAEALKRPVPELRDAAAKSLVALKAKDPRMLESVLDALAMWPYSGENWDEVDIVVAIGDAAIGPLIARLSARETKPSCFAELAACLGRLKAQKAAPSIVKALMARSDEFIQNDGYYEAAGALKAVDDLKDPSSTGLLIGGLRNDDPNVRILSAWALGILKAKDAEKPLRKALKDKNQRVQAEVEQALKNIGATI
jgi:HEAT repeat protein